MPKVLVTGSAGFIGFHLTKRLLSEGYELLAIDNINDYYDPSLKMARLKELGVTIEGDVIKSENPNFTFRKLNLEDFENIITEFKSFQPDYVVHLAAQAGVRYSLSNPNVYIKSNVDGFLSILEGCRAAQPTNFVFASSSSVYGLNKGYPFQENVHTDHPMSLYASTKRANEMMAHSYAHLYGIPSTGLRFFTAYGPWGRPDMALFLFAKNILDGKPIQVFNNGNMLRDFTFIDDLVEGIYRVMLNVPEENPSFDHLNPTPEESSAPYRILNIGNNAPVNLMDFIKAIEQAVGKEAIIDFQPLQPGDVTKTYADASRLQNLTGYKPNTDIQTGVNAFVEWYREYYGA